jgi:rare lipoprotein A (peptidoglycan hydrolase)
VRRGVRHALAISLLLVNAGARAGLQAVRLKSGYIQSKQTRGSERSIQVRHTRESRASQIGIASWYGKQYDGKITASGEPFDMYDFTAAHRSLPFGTYVRVTNPRNGRAVIVRINDRGPLVKGRLIDISYSAACVLDLQGKGVQRVRLDF